MQRGSTKRSWIKLWVTGWLHGSIRWQLDASERATWADLMCLAGECNHNGQICDNDGKAFPIDYIANQLNIPLDLLGATIAKCKAEGRIENREDGIIVIANWNAYQSEYNRQKKYRQKEVTNKNKKTYGQFKNVLLSDSEKKKLIDKFGDTGFEDRVEQLSLGIESKGYEYKSHYATILSWERMDEKRNAPTPKKNPRALPTKYTRPEEL